MMKKKILTLVCTLFLVSAVWAQRDVPYEIRSPKHAETASVQEDPSVEQTHRTQQALWRVQEKISPLTTPDGCRIIPHPTIPNVYTVMPVQDEDVINAKKAPATKAATDVSLAYVGHDNFWALVHKDHLPQTYNFYATVSNAGDAALTGVKLIVEVYTQDEELVYRDSTPSPINIQVGGTAEINCGAAFVLNQVNDYYVKYTAKVVGDANEDNNVLYRWIEVSDDVMAPFTENIPLRSSNFLFGESIVGTLIKADKTDTLTAVSYKTYSAASATVAKAAIYKVRTEYSPNTQEIGHWQGDTLWVVDGLDTLGWYDKVVSYELVAKSDDGIPYTYNMLNEYYLPVDRMVSGSQNYRGVLIEKDSQYIIGAQGTAVTIANTTEYNKGIVYGKLETDNTFTTILFGAMPMVRMHYGKVESLGAVDAGVKALVTPTQTYAIPSMLRIKADVKNYGSSEISGGSLTVYYQYKNGEVKNKLISTAIAPFQTLTVIFDDTLAILRPETATFKLWTSIAGDVNINNDTLISEIELVDPRYSWNFELPAWNFYSWNVTASRNMFSPWKTVDGDNSPVKSIILGSYNVTFASMSAMFGGGNVGNSGRRSFQGIMPAMAAPTLAGIASPHSGKKIGWVASPAGKANDWLISPRVKLNGNSSVELWAKALDGGDNVEKMQVLVSTVDDTSKFVKVSGSADVVIPKDWTKFSYDLNAYNDSNVYIAIRYVSDDQLFATFDNILIKTDFVDFVDFSVTAVSSPNIILDSTVTVTFQNMGSASVATPISLSYKIDNAATVTAAYSVLPITDGSVRNFTFPEKTAFSVGHHTIKVWVNYDLDDNRANDTFNYIVDINPLADTFRMTFEEMVDFSENFYPWKNLDEDKSLSYNIGSIDAPLSYTKEWQRIGFIVFNPETTIPASTARFQAKEGVKFGASIGVWDPVKQSNDWLISPPVTPTGDFNYIKFWVKSSVESDLEEYRVLVSTTDNNPASFVSLTPDTLKAPADWTEVAYNLNDYIGQQIYIAIQCVSNDGHTFMIDDINIVKGESASYKANVTEASAPSSYPKLPFDEAEVSVSIANAGNQKVKPVSVSYQLDGGTVVSENYSGDSIAWRESTVYTFTAKINIEAAGIHVLKAWVNGFAETDTFTQNIYINGEQNSMFLDFEDAYDFTSVLLPWENFDADGLPTITFNLTLADNKSHELIYPGSGKAQGFLVFNPAQTSISTLPNYIRPVSGDRIAISVRPVANTASSDWLISPQISLLQGTSKISFRARGLSRNITEKFRILVSTSGTSPENFTVVSGASPVTMDSSSWQEYSCNISSYANQDVYIAIQCVSDAEGAMFMIDDVEIYTSEINATEDNARANAVRLAPNPAQDVLKISSVTPIKEVVIYNVSGVEVMHSTATTLRVASLPAGIYVVKTLLSNGTVSISKFVKK